MAAPSRSVAVQGNQVVGILSDEADPAVSVMKVEHAPTESYADVGGLEQQIQAGGAAGRWGGGEPEGRGLRVLCSA